MYIEWTTKTGEKQRTIFSEPDHIPDVGDVYEALQDFTTAGDVHYKVGAELLIICRTDKAPWGRITSLGNLLVQGCDGKITIWSNIELAINDGWLGLKRNAMTS